MNKNYNIVRQWWYMSLIPAVRRLRYVDLHEFGLQNEFQDTKGYTGKCFLDKPKTKNQKPKPKQNNNNKKRITY